MNKITRLCGFLALSLCAILPINADEANRFDTESERGNIDSSADAKIDSNTQDSKNSLDSKKEDSKDNTQSADSKTQDSIKDSTNQNNDTQDVVVENGLFFHGGLEMFNRTSFNTKQSASNPLPSISYGYVLAELGIGYKYKSFEVGLGGVAAGLTHDSSNSLAYTYVGAYPGWNLNQTATADNTSRMFIHNAYLKYETDNISVTAGRFSKDSDWLASYVEGVDAHFNFAKNYHISLAGISTIALVGAGWLNDFATTYSYYGILNAEAGYANEWLKGDIFAYMGIKEYFAPGFNLELSFGKPESILYTTKINAIFPYHFDSINEIGAYFFSSFNAQTTGFTSSILLRQDVDFFDKYKLALAVYKNINNANARMGVFGNPIGIDVWDNTAYTIGNSLNAAVAPDALSVLFFSEVKYEGLHKYVKQLVLGIDARYTNAPSANEYSLKFNLGWNILENLDFNLTLNYYTLDLIDSLAWSDGAVDKARYTTDRSYLMTRVAYGF